jgi:hypothetical protein
MCEMVTSLGSPGSMAPPQQRILSGPNRFTPRSITG